MALQVMEFVWLFGSCWNSKWRQPHCHSTSAQVSCHRQGFCNLVLWRWCGDMGRFRMWCCSDATEQPRTPLLLIRCLCSCVLWWQHGLLGQARGWRRRVNLWRDSGSAFTGFCCLMPPPRPVKHVEVRSQRHWSGWHAITKNEDTDVHYYYLHRQQVWDWSTW